MSKQEFLAELRRKLNGLPEAEIEERLSFYSEMIDDKVEDGLTEDEAVAEIGTVEEVVPQIVSEVPLSLIVQEKVRSRRSLRAWEIILIILGSPIWLALLISFFAILLSLYITLWALIITLYAVDLSFAAAALACIPGAVFYAMRGSRAEALAAAGAGLMLAGLAILFFFAASAAARGGIILTRKMLLGIKTMFIGKEAAK